MKHIKPVFVSVVPELLNGEGHMIGYHLALDQALSLIGWESISLIPKKTELENLPQNWLKCLEGELLERGIKHFLKKQMYCSLILEFKKLKRSLYSFFISFVKNPNRSQSKVIFFIERFNWLQLLAFYSFIKMLPAASHTKINLHILYRMDIHKYFFMKHAYKIINNKIIKLLGQSNVKFFTDSHLLKQILEGLFEKTVHELPIPHIDFRLTQSNCLVNNNEKNFILWWPGQPRSEKGIEKIINIVSFIPSTELGFTYKFLMASSAPILLSQIKADIQFLPTTLTHDDYISILLSSNYILLPYDSNRYSERTSGIFVEAVIAKKIPLVTANTWMAQELYKFNLQELIFNWDPALFFEQLSILNKNLAETLPKIEKMSNTYRNCHNHENFAFILKNTTEKIT